MSTKSVTGEASGNAFGGKFWSNFQHAQLLSTISSYVFLAVILSLAVAPQYVFADTTIAGLTLRPVHYLIILLGVGFYMLFAGFTMVALPIYVAYTIVLLLSLTVATRFPTLSYGQSVETYISWLIGPIIFSARPTQIVRRHIGFVVAILAPLSVVFGGILELLTSHILLEREFTGALRLNGAMIPGFLAMFGVTGTMISVVLSRHDKRYLLLVAANIAITVWTGTRTQIVAAGAVFGLYLLIEIYDLWQQRDTHPWRPTAYQLGASVIVVLISLGAYVPQLLERTFYEPEYYTEETISLGGGSGGGSGNSRNNNQQGTTTNNNATENTSDTDSADDTSDNDDDDDGVQLYISGRNRTWNYFWDVAQEDIVFGRGIGTGVTANGGDLSVALETPHNVYLEWLVDGGIVGVVVIMIGYALFIFYLYRHIESEQLLFAGSMVIFAVLVVFKSMESLLPLWLYFFALYTILRADKAEYILGVRVDQLSPADIVSAISSAIGNKNKTRIFYVNAHILNMTWQNPQLRQQLNQAECVTCDGYGVKIIGWMVNYQYPLHRTTPPDWLMLAGDDWAKKKYRVFWLSTQQNIAEQAAQRFASQFPGVATAGVHHGYFEKSGTESDAVVTQINASNPDILIVGFGTPAQENWINSNREQLKVSVVIAVGAAVDYLADATPRGPEIATSNGFEWLTRLLIEPRRLWRRYLVGLPVLFMRTLGYMYAGVQPRRLPPSRGG